MTSRNIYRLTKRLTSSCWVCCSSPCWVAAGVGPKNVFFSVSKFSGMFSIAHRKLPKLRRWSTRIMTWAREKNECDLVVQLRWSYCFEQRKTSCLCSTLTVRICGKKSRLAWTSARGGKQRRCTSSGSGCDSLSPWCKSRRSSRLHRSEAAIHDVM